MENPPNVQLARDGRHTNRGVSSDGFFFNLPAAATRVGEGCPRTIKVETFVVRTGDQNRISRETHEAILALGVMGGLLFDRVSFSPNQKFGGSFTDEQRRKGGERPRLFRAFVFPPLIHLCSVLLIQPWLEGGKIECEPVARHVASSTDVFVVDCLVCLFVCLFVVVGVGVGVVACCLFECVSGFVFGLSLGVDWRSADATQKNASPLNVLM